MASFRAIPSAIFARETDFSGHFRESRKFSRNRCVIRCTADSEPIIAQRAVNNAETALLTPDLPLISGIA